MDGKIKGNWLVKRKYKEEKEKEDDKGLKNLINEKVEGNMDRFSQRWKGKKELEKR